MASSSALSSSLSSSAAAAAAATVGDSPHLLSPRVVIVAPATAPAATEVVGVAPSREAAEKRGKTNDDDDKSWTAREDFIATLTGMLNKRMERLVSEIEMDSLELKKIYAKLGITNSNTDLSLHGKIALRDDETRVDLKVSLDGLLKAMGRHREEGEAIQRETMYLQKITKQMEDSSSTG